MNEKTANMAKTKKPLSVYSQQSVSEVFQTILRHNFSYMEEWEEAANSWDDIEGVHQVRVSFRRMRSALKAFRPAVPREVSGHWAEEMRWCANQLGLARDMDVFIDEGLGVMVGLLPLPGEEEMAALARHHRAIAYENVRVMMHSDRYADFKKGFSAWLDSQGWLNEELTNKQRDRVESNIILFARKILDKQERQVLGAGTHVDRESAESMHQLRIECKELRYITEFFSPIFSGMDEFVVRMKGLQNLLWVLNDVNVMQQLLEILFTEEQDLKALQYAGGLVGWRTRQYHEIKNTFDEHWDEFVSAKHPWWRKSAIIS